MVFSQLPNLYTTKINVKIKPKTKITYVLILSILLVKSNKKTNEKAGSRIGIVTKIRSHHDTKCERIDLLPIHLIDSSSFCFTFISTSSLCPVNKSCEDMMLVSILNGCFKTINRFFIFESFGRLSYIFGPKARMLFKP